MAGLDPVPGRHPRLTIWAAAFRRAGWPLAKIAALFEIDPAELADAGVAR